MPAGLFQSRGGRRRSPPPPPPPPPGGVKNTHHTSGARPPPPRSPVAVKDPSIDCGAKPALELPKPHGASPTLVSFDALLVDTGDGQHAAHPIGSEVGVSQESRRVHQDELLGEVDDRARALHPAHHLEA